MSHYNELLAKMESYGIPFTKESLLLDGKIQRYSARKNGDLSEWYVGFEFPDGGLYCTFGSWRPGFEPQTHICNHCADESIPDEKIKFLYEKTQQIEKEWEEKRKEASLTAEKLFNSATLATPDFAYLARKKIKVHGVKVADNSLVIPLYNLKNQIKSLQFIKETGEKRFLAGGEVKENFFLIGDIAKAKTIRVCEGYATGASIFEAVGDCVAVAFSCHNLISVGHILKTAHKDKHIVLCADLGKAGDESVGKWKTMIGTETFQPDFKGKGKENDKDFNDLANHPDFGSETIKLQLQRKLKENSLYELFIMDKKIEWIIPNLLIKGSVNMIYGGAGAGKSAFCHSLAFAAAQGEKFLFWKPNPCKVLYVDGELSIAENISRWGSILKRYPEDLELNDNLKVITYENVINDFEVPINLYEEQWQRRLDLSFENYDLIFLDNLSTLSMFTEESHENNGATWNKIGNWLRKWKTKGKTIVVVHHSNKNGTSSRGSSMISVEMMTQIKMTALENKDENIDIRSQVVYEKHREISGKWKAPFELILNQNKWKAIN